MSEHRREPAGSIDPERGPRRLWDVVEKSPNAPESRSSGPKSELEFILDSTPDGVITIDGRGLVTSANSAAGQLLGHSPATLIGRPFHQLIARPDSIEHLAAQLMRDGDVRSAEFELLLAGGRRRWVSMSTRTRPLPTGTHSPDLTTLVFLRDVSDRHEAQEALEKKNDELEACVRGVSHDLRSPLVSILGFTRLLRDDYQDILSRTGLHFLERIEQAGRNMERLLHDLLELSRIGETSDCRVPVNPWPILDQLASELKLQLDEKGIALRLPEDVPHGPVRPN